jgi:ribose-phosphate pyrophosphokinase
MSVRICAFADEAAPAGRLAAGLGLGLQIVDLHRFPDGEGLPTVPQGADTVLVYRSLDRPDDKLIPLFLACEAWRAVGVRRLVLVAPYLCYMRQDTRFAPGQPISRDVIGRLLGERFDRIVTVDPHLHRTHDLKAVFDAPVTVLSAAKALAATQAKGGPVPLLVGPDIESEPWTAAVAAEMGADYITFRKSRRGDRSVDLALPQPAQIAGRPVLLVDDICSSGATLAAAARLLTEAGAQRVEAAVVHALFDQTAEDAMRAAGVARIVSTDSCPHSTNTAPLAATLAEALLGELSP